MVTWVQQQLPNTELPRLRETLIEWCEISSGSENLSGLSRMEHRLRSEFEPLADDCVSIPLSPYENHDALGQSFRQELGRALRLTRRSNAPIQILFSGHYDTVYDSKHPFQTCEVIDGGEALRGPGVADMKGGLLVMREAIRLLEASPVCDSIGWEIVLNPDEEIGTPGARDLLRDAAKGKHLGLVFECSTPQGGLVHQRLGSGNFVAEVRGKSAHAGRDFEEGRNAIEALSALVLEFRTIHREMESVIINTARFHAQSPLNAVPDRAVAQFNFRASDPESIEELMSQVGEARAKVEKEFEVAINWLGDFTRPPRIPDHRVKLMEVALEGCLVDLQQPFSWRNTGGGTDGSLLLDYGLPNIDSLGVRGANLHSDQEYMVLQSLIERIRLASLFLIRVANGEIDSTAL